MDTPERDPAARAPRLCAELLETLRRHAEIYTPLGQGAEVEQMPELSVRSTFDVAGTVSMTRAAVAEVSRDVSVVDVRTMDQQLDAALHAERGNRFAGHRIIGTRILALARWHRAPWTPKFRHPLAASFGRVSREPTPSLLEPSQP